MDRRELIVGFASLAGAEALSAARSKVGFAQQPDDILRGAEKAMGAQNLNTIRFSGRGIGAQFGQAYSSGMDWPRVNISTYARGADYKNSYTGEEYSRSRAEPRGGGPLAPVAESPFAGFATATHAWNGAGIETSLHRPNEIAPRMHDLWITPHGVILAALRSKATVSTRKEGKRTLTTVSFNVPQVMTATAVLNEDQLVERVESRACDTVLGEVDVVTMYSNYRDFNGVKFPTRIEQTRAGSMTLQLDIEEVVPHAAIYAETPKAVVDATEHVEPTEVAPGIWFLAGSSHNTVAVEMSDHIVIIDAPLGDDRTRSVLIAVKTLLPGKPIKYVVNSHVHFDHAGGLRCAAADGADVITHSSNVAYYEKAFATPNHIVPDALTNSGRKPRIIGVDDKMVLTDAKRNIELYHIEGSVHSADMLLAYLPKERLLVEVDLFHPPWPSDSPPPLSADSLAQELQRNLERLNLVGKVDQILPLHGDVVPISALSLVIGP